MFLFSNAKTYFFLGLIYEELEDFENAIKFYKEEVSLPTYPLLKNHEINYVINNIKSSLKNFE